MQRPTPPDMPVHRTVFEPDQDGLGEWARKCFIETGSPLTNPAHAHLQQAEIGWLWANSPSLHRGRRIAGECRMPKEGSRWSQMMGAYQLEIWFGIIPDFLIIIDAELASEAPDANFCALIEHELYHAAQALDLYGAPRFTREGDPVFTMRGHDVEEFVGVVERYGAEATGVSALVEAAKFGPILQDGMVSLACGSCGRKAA